MRSLRYWHCYYLSRATILELQLFAAYPDTSIVTFISSFMLTLCVHSMHILEAKTLTEGYLSLIIKSVFSIINYACLAFAIKIWFFLAFSEITKLMCKKLSCLLFCYFYVLWYINKCTIIHQCTWLINTTQHYTTVHHYIIAVHNAIVIRS